MVNVSATSAVVRIDCRLIIEWIFIVHMFSRKKDSYFLAENPEIFPLWCETHMPHKPKILSAGILMDQIDERNIAANYYSIILLNN